MMGPAKKKKASAKKTFRVVHEKKAVPKGKTLVSTAKDPAVQIEISSWGIYSFLGFFTLLVAGLYSLPNFHINLTQGGFFDRLLVHPYLIWVGMIGMAITYYRLPEPAERVEIPKWLAAVWFAFFFGLCFFYRFYHPLEPSAPFWYDNQVVIGDIRAIIDYGIHHLLFPFGEREPLFPYLTAGLWKLLPDANALWIIRLSCTVIDLGTIWGLYLLGSAIRGRRMGLILMAFWAVSLPMTIWNYFGMGQNTAVLACAWTLLFYYRLLQRPSLARFIYCGAALGFGAYTYVPFRPWTPSVITLLLIWILMGSKEKPKGAGPWVLAMGMWVSWVFLFLHKNNFLKADKPPFSIAVQPWFLGILVLVLLGAFIKTRLVIRESEVNRRIFGWAVGAVVTAVMMAPLLLHPDYSLHTTENSIFHSNGQLSPGMEAVKLLWSNIVFFVSAMFGTPSQDVSKYPLPGHSYFESFPVLAMLIGLAYFTARFTWRKAVVIVLILVGMCSFVLSAHAHTARVEAAIAPLLLLGAWGLDSFWSLVRRLINDKFWRGSVLLLVFALWAWDAQWNFALCRQWMAIFKSNDNVVSTQVDKDWMQYRVILSKHYPEFVMDDMTDLCDQKEVYLLNDPNPIYLEAGQRCKDIVLLMYGSSRHDQALEDRIKKEFPQAQWSVIQCPNPDIPNFMLRIVIPFDSLSESPDKLLYIQRVSHASWRRRFYCKDFGFVRGLVWWDERVTELKAALPKDLNVWETGQADAEIMVPASGDYVFQTNQTSEFVAFSVDGKELIHLRPENGFAPQCRVKKYITAGPHRVSLATTFQSVKNFPDVLIMPPGGAPEWVLGQPVLDSGH